MDTTTQTALSKAHHHLADDLANCSQLIDPLNSQALAMLYRSQRRLQDIGELAKLDKGPEPNTPEGLIGLFPEDTLANVRDTLAVLQRVDHEEGLNESARIGVSMILHGAREALNYENARITKLRKRMKS